MAENAAVTVSIWFAIKFLVFRWPFWLAKAFTQIDPKSPYWVDSLVIKSFLISSICATALTFYGLVFVSSSLFSIIGSITAGFTLLPFVFGIHIIILQRMTQRLLLELRWLSSYFDNDRKSDPSELNAIIRSLTEHLKGILNECSILNQFTNAKNNNLVSLLSTDDLLSAIMKIKSSLDQSKSLRMEKLCANEVYVDPQTCRNSFWQGKQLVKVQTSVTRAYNFSNSLSLEKIDAKAVLDIKNALSDAIKACDAIRMNGGAAKPAGEIIPVRNADELKEAADVHQKVALQNQDCAISDDLFVSLSGQDADEKTDKLNDHPHNDDGDLYTVPVQGQKRSFRAVIKDLASSEVKTDWITREKELLKNKFNLKPSEFADEQPVLPKIRKTLPAQHPQQCHQGIAQELNQKFKHLNLGAFEVFNHE